jgi:hypothetical protein
MMKLKSVLCLSMIVVPAIAFGVVEQDSADRTQAAQQAKELSGMSIVGNDEAPKSLYIVPWKSSELGVETSLDMMLDESAVPVDRDVFKRQLDFYEVRTTNRSRRIR